VPTQHLLREIGCGDVVSDGRVFLTARLLRKALGMMIEPSNGRCI